ncbi:hypothetical protein D3C80_1846050 [compost metagenome]
MQTDLRALATDFPTIPVIAENDQHRVADGLPGEAGAGRAERHRDLIALGQFQQGNHFVFGLDADHQLRDQPIEAGVGAKGQGRERVVETPLPGDQLLRIAQESRR